MADEITQDGEPKLIIEVRTLVEVEDLATGDRHAHLSIGSKVEAREYDPKLVAEHVHLKMEDAANEIVQGPFPIV